MDVVSVAFSWAFGRALTKATETLAGPERHNKLERELEEWLQDVLARYPKGIQRSALTAIFSVSAPNHSDAPRLRALQQRIAKNRMPTLDQFVEALVESWTRVHREKDVQPFFADDLDVIRPFLQDLARRFRDACEQDQPMFQREMISAVATMQKDLKELLTQTSIMRANVLAPATDSTPANWNPDWKPEKLVTEVTLKEDVSVKDLKPGTSVIVTFRSQPSGAWRDPQVESLAIWEASTKTAHPLASSMWGLLKSANRKEPPASEAYWKTWPLCIPSYEAPVEWRLESFVFENPWGLAKKRVVEKFLRLCGRGHIECRVVSAAPKPPGRGLALFVQSADYDYFLNMEWPYYKGLESALARGTYYKSKQARTLLGPALERFAEEEVAADPVFLQLIPSSYRKLFSHRTIEPRDVSIMMSGIIQRELEVRQRRQSQDGRVMVDRPRERREKTS